MCRNFGMLHKASKPKVGSYRPLSLTSCLVKLLEKTVTENLSNWAESNDKFNRQQNTFKKTEAQIYSNCLNQLNMVFTVVITGIFLHIEKDFDEVWFDGLLFKVTSMGINRKLTRWIKTFLYHGKSIISLNNQLGDSIIPIYGIFPRQSFLPQSFYSFRKWHISTYWCTVKSFLICSQHCNLGTESRYFQYKPLVAKISEPNSNLVW